MSVLSEQKRREITSSPTGQKRELLTRSSGKDGHASSPAASPIDRNLDFSEDSTGPPPLPPTNSNLIRVNRSNVGHIGIEASTDYIVSRTDSGTDEIGEKTGFKTSRVDSKGSDSRLNSERNRSKGTGFPSRIHSKETPLVGKSKEHIENASSSSSFADWWNNTMSWNLSPSGKAPAKNTASASSSYSFASFSSLLGSTTPGAKSLTQGGSLESAQATPVRESAANMPNDLYGYYARNYSGHGNNAYGGGVNDGNDIRLGTTIHPEGTSRSAELREQLRGEAGEGPQEQGEAGMWDVVFRALGMVAKKRFGAQDYLAFLDPSVLFRLRDRHSEAYKRIFEGDPHPDDMADLNRDDPTNAADPSRDPGCSPNSNSENRRTAACELKEKGILIEALICCLYMRASYGVPMFQGYCDHAGTWVGGTIQKAQLDPTENEVLNQRAFQELTGGVGEVLVSSYSELMCEPGFVLSVNHRLKSLILSVRGTLSWRDVMTDIVISDMDFVVRYPKRGGKLDKDLLSRWIYNSDSDGERTKRKSYGERTKGKSSSIGREKNSDKGNHRTVHSHHGHHSDQPHRNAGDTDAITFGPPASPGLRASAAGAVPMGEPAPGNTKSAERWWQADAENQMPTLGTDVITVGSSGSSVVSKQSGFSQEHTDSSSKMNNSKDSQTKESIDNGTIADQHVHEEQNKIIGAKDNGTTNPGEQAGTITLPASQEQSKNTISKNSAFCKKPVGFSCNPATKKAISKNSSDLSAVGVVQSHKENVREYGYTSPSNLKKKITGGHGDDDTDFDKVQLSPYIGTEYLGEEEPEVKNYVDNSYFKIANKSGANVSSTARAPANQTDYQSSPNNMISGINHTDSVTNAFIPIQSAQPSPVTTDKVPSSFPDDHDAEFSIRGSPAEGTIRESAAEVLRDGMLDYNDIDLERSSTWEIKNDKLNPNHPSYVNLQPDSAETLGSSLPRMNTNASSSSRANYGRSSSTSKECRSASSEDRRSASTSNNDRLFIDQTLEGDDEHTETRLLFKCHEGITKSADFVYRKIHNWVERFYKKSEKHRNYRFVFTGHSLGAATAALVFYKFPQIRNKRLVMFGVPCIIRHPTEKDLQDFERKKRTIEKERQEFLQSVSPKVGRGRNEANGEGNYSMHAPGDGKNSIPIQQRPGCESTQKNQGLSCHDIPINADPRILSIVRGKDFISQMSVESFDRLADEISESSYVVQAFDWFGSVFGGEGRPKRNDEYYREKIPSPPGKYCLHLQCRPSHIQPKAYWTRIVDNQGMDTDNYKRILVGLRMIDDHLPNLYLASLCDIYFNQFFSRNNITEWEYIFLKMVKKIRFDYIQAYEAARWV